MNRATLNRINALRAADAVDAFLRCCGARRWAMRMTELRPFGSQAELLAAADAAWPELNRDDWLEAFRHHPRIGDLQSLEARFADTGAWAASEQSGVQEAPSAVLAALAEGNRAYEARFGYVFLVCATGLTAVNMLDLLRARLPNEPEDELPIAVEEQKKITRLRLRKLHLASALTTHVLDTGSGRPARDVPVSLEFLTEEAGAVWKLVGEGSTDSEGRLATLLPEEIPLQTGIYRLTFDTQAYFRSRGQIVFYPCVQIQIHVQDADEHYHVPLLLSCYGYTTYRGS